MNFWTDTDLQSVILYLLILVVHDFHYLTINYDTRDNFGHSRNKQEVNFLLVRRVSVVVDLRTVSL